MYTADTCEEEAVRCEIPNYGLKSISASSNLNRFTGAGVADTE